jgi:hypothetical protein
MRKPATTICLTSRWRGVGLLILPTLAAVGNAAPTLRYLPSLEPAAAEGVQLRTVIATERITDRVIDENIETLHCPVRLAMVGPMLIEHVPARALEINPLLRDRCQRNAIDSAKVTVRLSDHLTEIVVDVRGT